MNKARCFLLAVAAAAMAFTVSCTSDIESAEDILAKLSSSSEGNSQSYGYCLFSEDEMCLKGPYTLNDCNSIGGKPSNNCPYSSVALPSSSGGEAPSSSSVETDNEPSSSSDAPSSPSVTISSSSVAPSSSSVVPSSSSALPSSSSVAPSSGSTSVCDYELTGRDQRINIPNEPVVICMNLPFDWKLWDDTSIAYFECDVPGGNGRLSGKVGNLSISGEWFVKIKIPYDWTINGYELSVDLQFDGYLQCKVAW